MLRLRPSPHLHYEKFKSLIWFGMLLRLTELKIIYSTWRMILNMTVIRIWVWYVFIDDKDFYISSIFRKPRPLHRCFKVTSYFKKIHMAYKRIRELVNSYHTKRIRSDEGEKRKRGKSKYLFKMYYITVHSALTSTYSLTISQ